MVVTLACHSNWQYKLLSAKSGRQQGDRYVNGCLMASQHVAGYRWLAGQAR